jgi:hypothetical protein
MNEQQLNALLSHMEYVYATNSATAHPGRPTILGTLQQLQASSEKKLRALFLEPEPEDTGTWTTGVSGNDRIFLESSDFAHDVRLYVDGDFVDRGQKLSYALGIANRLNATNKEQQ